MRAWWLGWFGVVSAGMGCGSAVDCATLDPETCASEAKCVVIEGTPVEILSTVTTDPSSPGCYSDSGPAEAVGCRQDGGECPPVERYAVPPDADALPWRFPHGCVPEGWEEATFFAPC